jgi:hypothetical protein
MIRRFVRIVVAGFCLLSLLTCVGTAWLWCRTGRGEPDWVSFRPAKVRYSLCFRDGGIDLLAPPRAGAGADSVRKWLERSRDRELRWQVDRSVRGRVVIEGVILWPSPDHFWDDPGPYFHSFAPTDVAVPLLEALEDPATVALAHWGLTQKFDPQYGLQSDGDGAVGLWHRRGTAVYNGMRVEFPDGARQRPMYEAGRIDPAQGPAISEQWHRRLDVIVGSVPYAGIAIATAVPPLLWAGARVGRARLRSRRERLGLCLACGYDLRHSSMRCPECGAPATAR